MIAKTLYDKIWDAHLVDLSGDGVGLMFVDRHFVHEVTSPQAFESLRKAGRKVRSPERTIVVPDHNVPTTHDRERGIADLESQIQVRTLEDNVRHFSLPHFYDMNDPRQGIVHVIGPEQGWTLPGTTIVCGDSHTPTHGAFGALAFGIGTTEVEHVLATQALIQSKAYNMRVRVEGTMSSGVTAKDLALHIIGVTGTNGGRGHVVEYQGAAIRALSMEGRMTLCNLAIEGGARAGLIAPDEKTFAYLKGRPHVPKGVDWTAALSYWRELYSDPDASFDREIVIHAEDVVPTVTWGTSPEDTLPITGRVPAADTFHGAKSAAAARALDYMGLVPGMKLTDVEIDAVFIGSCTNGRIEDLRAAAGILRNRKVSNRLYMALIVPGSGLVRAQAEEEGLAEIFQKAGFDWRLAGCSMCLGMNSDQLSPGMRCASTSNRNFEGRQGFGGRTHLMSPSMAAAAAIRGRLADVREFFEH